MKKIATLTTHAALNYGAVLQAYALCSYINSMGYPCDVLNYVPEHVHESYQLIQPPKSIQGLILSCFQGLYYSARKERQAKFTDFRKQYLHLSGPQLKTHQDLIATANHYDFVVCGSDQIWNPLLHNFDEAYFLSFPDVTAQRVSYAASFGQDEIDPFIKPELQRRLTGFSDFACRENSGQRLIKELANKNAAMVLDPVFLLNSEHWHSLATDSINPKPYALSYFLSNPGQSPFALKKYAQSQNLEVLSIGFSPRDWKYGIRHNYSLGPQEFLGAIASAECILTNSFHCTAFAIIMQKPFYTRISNQAGSRNDRMVSLLTSLGLEDRLYYDRDVDQLDFSKPIDYAAVNERLNALITESKDYLIRVLEK